MSKRAWWMFLYEYMCDAAAWGGHCVLTFLSSVCLILLFSIFSCFFIFNLLLYSQFFHLFFLPFCFSFLFDFLLYFLSSHPHSFPSFYLSFISLPQFFFLGYFFNLPYFLSSFIYSLFLLFFVVLIYSLVCFSFPFILLVVCLFLYSYFFFYYLIFSKCSLHPFPSSSVLLCVNSKHIHTVYILKIFILI